MGGIFALVDQGEIPKAFVPMHGEVTDPDLESRDGGFWGCGFCPHKPTCVKLGPGRQPLERAEAVAVEPRPPPTRTPGGPLVTAIPPSRSTLLERIKALSPDQQEQLKERWPPGCPSLKAEGHTLAQLGELHRQLTVVENLGAEPAPAAAPSAPAPAVSDFRARWGDLPDDLRRQVQAEAKAANVHDVDQPGPEARPGPQDARDGRGCRGAAAPVDPRVAQRLRHGWRRRAAPRLRPRRHRRPHHLEQRAPGEEATALLDAVAKIHLGLAGLTWTDAGVPSIAPTPTATEWSVDWKAKAAELGTTQAALLRRAQEIAADLGQARPTNLAKLEPGLAQLITTSSEPAAPVADAPAESVTAPKRDVSIEGLTVGLDFAGDDDQAIVVVHRATGVTVVNVPAEHTAQLYGPPRQGHGGMNHRRLRQLRRIRNASLAWLLLWLVWPEAAGYAAVAITAGAALLAVLVEDKAIDEIERRRRRDAALQRPVRR
ncbi:MAG: hypothetical protein QM757_14750 [Paludibaculum sp.]